MNQQNSEGYALISKAKFMNSSIFNSNPLILLNQLSNIDLMNVLIKDVVYINSQHTSIFMIQDCKLVTISESHFINNINSNGPGGVIYALNNKKIIIQNSIFWLNICKLQSGGAIYMINTIIQGVLKINQTQLIENKSGYSSGGSIYLENNNMIMQNSVIASNQAQIGGGIYYTQVMPDFLTDLQQGNKNNNTFKDNLGYIYGQNFGSTLRKVFINLENIKIPKYSLKLYEDKDIFIKKLKSGDQINLEQIQLLDEENNPIRFIDVNSTDFSLLSSDVQSLVQQISVSVQWNQENKEIQCVGQLQTKQFTNGGFNLDVQIFYKPISELVLKIQSNSFPSLIDSNGKIVVNYGQIELILNIELEQCSIGQIFKQYGSSIACETCPDGKYSLSLNDQECKICPESAVRCIGSNIQLKSGYWREDENTDNIIYCSMNPQSCQPQLSSSKFYCIEGHKGPLCYQCDTYGDIWGSRYSEIYNHGGECYKCEQNIDKIVLYNLLAYLMISLYIIIILRRIIMQLEVKVKGYYLNKLEIIYLGSTLNQSDRSQIISKILTDHLQILSLVCSFATKMPAFFTVPIQLSGNSVSVVSKSIDCVFSKHPNLQPLWLFQFLWSFTLPAGILIFYIVQGFILKRLQIDFFIRYLQTAAIFIYFYFYPMIITLAIRSINCITIGDKKYLDLDFGIECYDKHQHKPYIFLFTIPVIFIWGFVIPLLLFYKIHDAKSKKKSIIKQIKYSFLFAGYKKQYYYWEFWKLSYKTSLILISVLIQQNIQLKFIANIDSNMYTTLVIGLLRLKITNQEKERTFLQNLIFKLKKKYPQLLYVEIQNSQKELDNSPSSPQSHLITQTETIDEKQQIMKKKNSNKRIANKWPYYTRNSKQNQISLKDRTFDKQNLFNSNAIDSIIQETECSPQNNQQNNSPKFQIQLSLDKS
ncbi:transmembrane protein, putative (macronuclear) [Tetrahymena thermophila SB210]|uniref:Transmembrane protein, putative n=1 Tax=Tetrahymena thermophila (strain SB210) TaxID=312017 RepID=W7XJH6_TETTS|nr:transmembrane protein, putative [Tetrahymena thermophila SB210]EWS75531.1 transmembrane protein, putative [Tetrahymena thermophila SB210]|eukprot:XP_012651934.1 transmembrane protein, putative [Tetrahymena thermophila SB210]